MNNDERELRELNLKITEAENTGDAEWLSKILAPRLAFQRADELRTADDQVAFLQKVKPGGTRVSGPIEPIEIYGNRAVVQCIVKVGDQEFHNLRLFVRREAQWRLLAWANEPV